MLLRLKLLGAIGTLVLTGTLIPVALTGIGHGMTRAPVCPPGTFTPTMTTSPTTSASSTTTGGLAGLLTPTAVPTGQPTTPGTTLSVTGVVARITSVQQGSEIIYYLAISGQPLIFTAPLSLSPQLPLVAVGDTVTGTYQQTGSGTAALQTLTDESLANSTATPTATPTATTTPTAGTPTPTSTMTATVTPTGEPTVMPTAPTCVTPTTTSGTTWTPGSFPVPPTDEPYNPPIPATALGYPASDGNIRWDGGFETGDFRQYRIENWGDLDGGGWGNSSGVLVTSPVEHDSYSLKLTVNPPDSPGAANRAQISTSTAQDGIAEGQTWYYSFGMYLPSQPDRVNGWPAWTNVSQWLGGCYPTLQLFINAAGQYVVESQPNDPVVCNGNGPTQEWIIGTVAYDTWEDFTFRVHWSMDPAKGSVTVWHDGNLVLPTQSVQTMQNVPQTWDLQVYRDGGQTTVVYFDSVRVHTAFASNPA